MVQRCHYEVLGVARDASPEEIKKAYKRVALEWHPDKNLDRLSEATVQFQLIRQAFEVLSDPNERAWYDEHRTIILNGGLDSDFKEEIVNIQPYFSRSCFKGFHDGPMGYYQVFGKLFQEIHQEDQLFWPKDDFERPQFGDSNSPYKEGVEPFYTYWLNFETQKPYTWCNVYDPHTADNRKVLKLILKENKKMQNYARKKRNQEIRNFVTYVRKLDPRVAAYKEVVKQRGQEKAAKLQQHINSQKEKRKKELAQYFDQYQEDFKLLEDDLKVLEDTVDQMFEGSNDEEDDPLYCCLCNKHFRSEKAFANHEKSKKHKENLQYLAQEVAEDEGLIESLEQLDLEEDINLNEELTEEDEEVPSAMSTTNSKKKKRQNKQQIHPELEEEDEVMEEKYEEEKEAPPSMNCDKKKKKKRQRKQQTSYPDFKEDQEEQPQEPVQQEEVGNLMEEIERPSQETKSLPTPSQSQETQPPKLKGKKAKEARKKAQASQAQEEKPVVHKCNSCTKEFPTRNKLFDHLKSTGHQKYIGASKVRS